MVQGVPYMRGHQPLPGGGGGNAGLNPGFQSLLQGMDMLFEGLDRRRTKKVLDGIFDNIDKKGVVSDKDIAMAASVSPQTGSLLQGIKESNARMLNATSEMELKQAQGERMKDTAIMSRLEGMTRGLKDMSQAERYDFIDYQVRRLSRGDEFDQDLGRELMALYYSSGAGGFDFSDNRVNNVHKMTLSLEHVTAIENAQSDRDLQVKLAQMQAQNNIDVAQQQGLNQANVAQIQGQNQLGVVQQQGVNQANVAQIQADTQRYQTDVGAKSALDIAQQEGRTRENIAKIEAGLQERIAKLTLDSNTDQIKAAREVMRLHKQEGLSLRNSMNLVSNVLHGTGENVAPNLPPAGGTITFDEVMGAGGQPAPAQPSAPDGSPISPTGDGGSGFAEGSGISASWRG